MGVDYSACAGVGWYITKEEVDKFYDKMIEKKLNSVPYDEKEYNYSSNGKLNFVIDQLSLKFNIELGFQDIGNYYDDDDVSYIVSCLPTDKKFKEIVDIYEKEKYNIEKIEEFFESPIKICYDYLVD